MHREEAVSPANALLLMKSPLAPKPSQANLANDTGKYSPKQKCTNLVESALAKCVCVTRYTVYR